MYLYEKEFSIPAAPGHKEILLHVEQALKFRLSVNETPIRIAITETTNENYRCEVGVLQSGKESSYTIEPITNFSKRLVENTNSFNTVLLVPTGIGSEIGGHAGDATPVAKLLAEVSDTLITHPNVVNASDLNEMSDNTLYVEGSVISRWMMGTIGLQKTRSNRVIFVIDDHPDSVFTSAAINAVSAAHASYGFNCVEVVKLDPSVKMKSEYTDSGMAVGEIRNFEYLCEVLSKQEGD